jgi:hypothetical protein
VDQRRVDELIFAGDIARDGERVALAEMVSELSLSDGARRLSRGRENLTEASETR